MDDSHVISFGPSSSKERTSGAEDETVIDEQIMTSSSRANLGTDGLMGDAQREIKSLVDECITDFTSKMNCLLAKFESPVCGSHNTHTPILGRGEELSLRGRDTDRENLRTNCNNSHSWDRDGNITDIKCKIKPQIYDGSDDLEEYLTQFNLLAELNNWGPKPKALLLASSLSGGARAILSEMTEAERRDYDCLVSMLKNRFGSVNRSEVFRAELQTRVKQRNETLPELAQAIKKLTRHAYPGSSPIVRDTLAIDYFIDAIPETEIRLRLREVGPKTIGEAENIAVRLEALRIADRQKGRSVRVADTQSVDKDQLLTELKEVKSGLKTLQNEMGVLKRTPNNNNKGSRFRQEGNQNRPGNFVPRGPSQFVRGPTPSQNQQGRRPENYPRSGTGVGPRLRY